MENTVFFENDKLRYQSVSSKYLEDTLAVTKSTIFTDGNMSKSIGVPQDPEAMNELEKFSLSLIEDGTSVIAIDKNKDKVVGISLNKVFAKHQAFYEVYASSFKNLRARQVIEMRRSTLFMVNLFDIVNTDRLMELVLLGILPDYRKQGIAKRMCEITIYIAQQLHDGMNARRGLDGQMLPLEPRPDGLVAMFSSFISQKIGRDLGFTVATERSNYKWEVLGSVIVNKNVITPTTTVEYLKLK